LLNLQITSTSLNLSISTGLVFDYGASPDWAILGGSIGVVLVLLAITIHSTYRIESRRMDHFLLSAQGFYSLVQLSVVYFQYFGVYLLYLLTIDSVYFGFYIAATIVLIIMATSVYKLSFYIFITRNINNPDLMNNGIRSPRGKFICMTLIFLIINYVFSTVIIHYVSYGYYISVLSSFPIINIIENAFRHRKSCFNWYVNILNLGTSMSHYGGLASCSVWF
jgi:uncharacterized membrane protein